MNHTSLSPKQYAFISRAATGNIAQMRVLYRAISDSPNVYVANTALIKACANGQLNAVKYLLAETGAEIDAVSETYLETLRGYLPSQSIDILLCMAQHGPLRTALQHRQNAVVLFLLDHGAKAYSGVLADAMTYDNCASLIPLIEYGATVGTKEFFHWSIGNTHGDPITLLHFLVTNQRLQQRNDIFPEEFLVSEVNWHESNVEMFESQVNQYLGDESTICKMKRIVIGLRSQLGLTDDQIQYIHKSTKRTFSTWLRKQQEQKAEPCGHNAIEVFTQCAAKDVPLIFSWIDKNNHMFHLIGLVDHLNRSHKNPLTRAFFTADEIGEVYKLYYNCCKIWKQN